MALTRMADAALGFVIVGVILAVGIKVLAGMQTGMTGVAAAAISNATAGISELASWLPTIGLVIAASIVIAVIVWAFTNLRSGETAQ